MCDFLYDLIREKIFINVLIIFLRVVWCICKLWNVLFKEFIVGREILRQYCEFLGFMMVFNKIYFFSFDI